MKKELTALILLILISYSYAANLVVNGSFESGNTGFSSAYAYQSNLYPAGTYYVGSNPQAYHSSFWPISAKEGSNMMILNGASTANQSVWSQSGIAVTPNTTYFFSTWLASVTGSEAANLRFSINGSIIGSLTASLDGAWKQFYTTWNSGSSTTANLALVNMNTASGGNDFALDSIVLDTYHPVEPLLSASSTNFGNVLVGSSGTATVTVTNIGSSTSTLTGGIGPSSQGEITPGSGTQSFSLGQNQINTRTFTYAPTSRGADSTSISITSNGGNTTRTISGTGVAAINQVTTTNAATTRVGTSNNASVKIQNTGDGNLSGLGETSNLRGTVQTPTGSVFSGNTTSVSLADGASQTLNYVYTPTSRGTNNSTVQINFANGNSNGTNSSQTVSANISGVAVSPEYVSSVAPGSVIDLGTVEAYSTNQYTLRIQNLTPDADLGNLTNLSLLSATISGIDASFFSIQNFSPVVLGKNAYIDLILTITNPEWRFSYKNATLTVLTDQNAAFGSAGQSFTYTLTALCVPETSSWLMIIIALSFIGISCKKNC